MSEARSASSARIVTTLLLTSRKPPADEDALVDARMADAQLAECERRQQRRMARQDAELALAARRVAPHRPRRRRTVDCAVTMVTCSVARCDMTCAPSLHCYASAARARQRPRSVPAMIEVDLGDVVVLALEDLLEAANRVLAARLYVPGRPVNASPTMNGCEKNCSILRARATVSLSSSESSSTPRMAMMSCRSL